jgi:hypothetical protein
MQGERTSWHFPLGPPTSSREIRSEALARFRAKKAKRLLAPKVRYAARKRLADARPRFRGQFIKADALPAPASCDSPPGEPYQSAQSAKRRKSGLLK